MIYLNSFSQFIYFSWRFEYDTFYHGHCIVGDGYTITSKYDIFTERELYRTLFNQYKQLLKLASLMQCINCDAHEPDNRYFILHVHGNLMVTQFVIILLLYRTSPLFIFNGMA